MCARVAAAPPLPVISPSNPAHTRHAPARPKSAACSTMHAPYTPGYDPSHPPRKEAMVSRSSHQVMAVLLLPMLYLYFRCKQGRSTFTASSIFLPCIPATWHSIGWHKGCQTAEYLWPSLWCRYLQLLPPLGCVAALAAAMHPTVHTHMHAQPNGASSRRSSSNSSKPRSSSTSKGAPARTRGAASTASMH